MANALCVKDNALAVCGPMHALIVGECTTITGACCFGIGGSGPPPTDEPVQSRAPQCIQLTAAECQQSGGIFMGPGIPCVPNPCDVPPPGPPCCTDTPCECFQDGPDTNGTTYTVTWSLLYEVDWEPPGSQPIHSTSTFEGSEVLDLTQNGTCLFGVGPYGVTSDTFSGQFSRVDAHFDSCPNLLSGQHYPAIIATGSGIVPPGFVDRVGCGGGAFGFDIPDHGPSLSFKRGKFTGSIRVTRARRCDNQPERGRCCYDQIPCADNILQSDCLAAGGDWSVGTCLDNPCPTAACCRNGVCTESTEAECYPTGIWFPGRHCGEPDQPCTILGACCLGTGVCQEPMTAQQCFSGGGFSFQPSTISGLPYVPVCGTFECDPPLPCCNDPSCSTCYVRGSVSPIVSIAMQMQADFWGVPVGQQCQFIDVRSDQTSTSTPLTQDTCNWESQAVGITLFAPPPFSGTIFAFAQFKSCNQAPSLGPHIALNIAGSQSTHAVTCSGGNIQFTHPQQFGTPCGTGRTWRNVTVSVQTSTQFARNCNGTLARLARPPRRRVLVPGVDFPVTGTLSAAVKNCGKCGQGLGRRIA